MAKTGAGGEKDPFADPYGPTSNCFSANDLVRMFRLGAVQRDVDHLSDCAACRERVERFSRVAGGALLNFVKDPVPVIMASKGTAEPVRVQLYAPLIAKSNYLTLQLDGSINAGSPDIHTEGDWMEAIFSNARLSGEVLKHLKRHNRVTDQILLRATTADARQIIGTSNIEFDVQS